MRDLDVIDLAVIALATWQAVEVAHHGEIFTLARAVAEVRRRWVDRLFLCPYCLSVWTATALAAIWSVSVPAPVTGRASWMFTNVIMFWSLAKLCVLGLAVSRLANLANDLARPVTRTPNRSTPSAGPSQEQYE